jgi:hypothetical protein
MERYAFGQIFRAPAYYPHQQLEIWRPLEVDQRLGTARNFVMQRAGEDAFRRSVPLAFPPLAINEEFIALRAKKRPMVLIQPPDPALESVKRQATGGKIVRHLCSVLLAYSAEDEAGFAKFPRQFIDDVRLLKYPQFLFLPKGGPFLRDGLLRLDAVQSITLSNIEPTEWMLSPDVLGIFKSQLSFFMTGLASEEFRKWRDELQKQN